jgi:hypothetical protein
MESKGCTLFGEDGMNIRKIHDGIIDNPDFNLTVAAKRDLRELCAENERLRAECGLRQIQGYHEGTERATEQIEQKILYLEDRIAELAQDLADMDAENTRLLHDRDTAFDEGMEAAAEIVMNSYGLARHTSCTPLWLHVEIAEYFAGKILAKTPNRRDDEE